MKKTFLILNVLLLLFCVALIYLTRQYILFSALYLISWLLFFISAAYFRRRRCALVGAACWLLISMGLLPTLIPILQNLALPAFLEYGHMALYGLLVLPLAGLPGIRLYGVPLALFLCALGVMIYYFLRRADSAPLSLNESEAALK